MSVEFNLEQLHQNVSDCLPARRESDCMLRLYAFLHVKLINDVASLKYETAINREQKRFLFMELEQVCTMCTFV